MIKKLALTTGGIIAASTFSVSAGGFELSPLSTAFMYETGGYAEMSYSTRDYNVTGSNYAPTGSAVGDQSHAAFAFKFDLSEDFSLGFTRYRQGSIQLDYSGAGSVFAAGLPVVSLDIDASVLLGRYKFNDKYSVIGGLKKTTIRDATANIFQSVSLPASAISGASEIGYVYGVAYQRDDIALRVELTHETATDFAADTTNATAGPGITTGSTPDYLNLAFQSGVAKDTLVFGSIRKANWASNQIQVHPDPTPTSSFNDTTTYNIGVGRKINDEFSIFASYATEAAGDPAETSPLNITNGYKGVSLGVNYEVADVKVTVGMNYTKIGDVNLTTSAGPGSFTDNTVKSLGFKIGYSF